MHADVTIPAGLLFGFLLTLARFGGVLVAVPIPGFRQAPKTARMVLGLGLTFVVVPTWPQVAAPAGTGTMLVWLGAETALGVTAGVILALLNEGFVLACQTLGMQAGYSFATTIDPSSQADSGILQIFGQLMAALFFFSLGLDRHLLRILAGSLESHPPGTFALGAAAANTILELGAGMFSLGVRLALPVAGFLMLADLALALLGRINSQLQLLMLAFPVKMLAALAMVAAMAGVFPVLYEQSAARSIAGLVRLVGR